MKGTKFKQYVSDTNDIDTLPPPAVSNLTTPEPDTLMRGKQGQASDSYYQHDTEEFCAWGYPMDLGNY
jgi:hypothetical protein